MPDGGMWLLRHNAAHLCGALCMAQAKAPGYGRIREIYHCRPSRSHAPKANPAASNSHSQPGNSAALRNSVVI